MYISGHTEIQKSHMLYPLLFPPLSLLLLPKVNQSPRKREQVSIMQIPNIRRRPEGQEIKSNFKKTLKEYLATSTIHGLAQIGR